MNYALRVGRRDSRRHLHGKFDGFTDGQVSLLQSIAQRRTINDFHGDEKPAFGLADFVDGCDVRM